MGMFDYLKVEYPLPLTADQLARAEWQTKDTPSQFMDEYRLTADGRLIEPQIERFTIPEDERPYCKGKRPEDRTDLDKLFGMMGSRLLGEKDLHWHGGVSFYDSIDDEWFEFHALFENGTVKAIVRVPGYGQDAVSDLNADTTLTQRGSDATNLT